MRKEKDLGTAKTLGIIVLAVCMLAIGYTAGKLTNFNPIDSLKSITSDQPDLSLFWKVWDVMESQFVNAEDISVEEKKYGAIKGLVDSYNDPATTFFNTRGNRSLSK